MAKHVAGCKVVWQLIDGSRRELMLGVQGFLDKSLKQHRTGVVNRWIAKVDGDGVVTVLATNATEAIFDQIKCIVPGDRFEIATGVLSHWQTQTIGIGMYVLQRDRFGAQMPTTKRVFWVPFDRKDLLVIVLNRQTTNGFTKIAAPVSCLRLAAIQTSAPLMAAVLKRLAYSNPIRTLNASET